MGGESGVDARTGLLFCSPSLRGPDDGGVLDFLVSVWEWEEAAEVSMALSLSLFSCSYSSKSVILRVIRVSFWLNISALLYTK